MTQCEMILHHLQLHGSISPKEAESLYGCMRLASRVCDLRKRGWPIGSIPETAENRFGNKTTYSRYTLRRIDAQDNN